MTDAERDRFDALLERVLADLPPQLHALLDEVPLIVLDQPTPPLLAELGFGDDPDAADELCGLHTGIPDTEASVEHSAELPPDIHLFRRGILLAAKGWESGDNAVAEQIRITILHEIGHQFGLDEDDLADLGYD